MFNLDTGQPDSLPATKPITVSIPMPASRR
jgi:hypothetical protein